MGGLQSWSLTAKPCDTCKAAAATVFCRADSAFLCAACDEDAHAAADDSLHSRHARVWVCEVCEQAPAAVTCKADAAALCHTCDRDIHSANPLALRHERIPIVPFYDAAVSVKKSSTRGAAAAPAGECSDEEAEAASWLLPDPNSKPDDESGLPEYKSAGYLFSEMDPYLDLDLGSGQQKLISRAMVDDDDQQKQYCSDGVVPVQKENEYGSGRYPGPAVDGFPTYDLDYPAAKPFMYNFTSQSITQTVSCSSLDVGVVPDDSTTVDTSNTQKEEFPVRLSGVDREARVMRYKEKRKNRKFEKTIRYASRKAYAETRPRVKGRFAKRETDASPYGVVPTC